MPVTLPKSIRPRRRADRGGPLLRRRGAPRRWPWTRRHGAAALLPGSALHRCADLVGSDARAHGGAALVDVAARPHRRLDPWLDLPAGPRAVLRRRPARRVRAVAGRRDGAPDRAGADVRCTRGAVALVSRDVTRAGPSCPNRRDNPSVRWRYGASLACISSARPRGGSICSRWEWRMEPTSRRGDRCSRWLSGSATSRTSHFLALALLVAHFMRRRTGHLWLGIALASSWC